MAGLRTPYGKNLETNRLVHISELSTEQRGLKCGMNCVKCGAPLVARFRRKSKTFRPHFAHYQNTGCFISEESLLHLYAKQVLLEEEQLWVPGVEIRYGRFVDTVFREETAQLTNVTLEQKEGSFIPDVTAEIRGVRVFIEILVTHAVDEEKLEQIKQSATPVLEINLEDMPRDATREEIVAAVCHNGYPRSWLHIPHYQKRLAQLIRKDEQPLLDVNNQTEEALEQLRRTVGRMVSVVEDSTGEYNAFAEAPFTRYQYAWLDGTWLRVKKWETGEGAIYERAFEQLLAYPPEVFITFNSFEANSHPYLWQASIYRDVLLQKKSFSVAQCVEMVTDAFRLHSKIKWDIVFAHDVEQLRSLGIFNAQDAVRFYLEYLETQGFVQAVKEHIDDENPMYASNVVLNKIGDGE